MRIAVPTNDGTSISEHFGRSAAFLIFETENGQIKSRGLKTNAGEHSHPRGEHKDPLTGVHSHDHTGILTTLEGCEMVICAGMGHGAAEALKGRGMQIVFAAPGPADQTVAAYLGGKLSAKKAGFCRCGQ
jgi:predicted Fe-Mo cluster-binding NifX family protein